MVPGSSSDAAVPTWASSVVQHQEPHKHYFWRTTVGRPTRCSQPCELCAARGRQTTQLVLRRSVISIKDVAFHGFQQLESVRVEPLVDAVPDAILLQMFMLKLNRHEPGIAAIIESAAPPTMGSVGKQAFYGCCSLTTVELPAKTHNIDQHCFSGCTRLRTVRFPPFLIAIGSAAFFCCTALVEVTLPQGLVAIRSDAFSQCTALRSIEIPNTVRTIGDNAFYGCTSLVSVELGSNGGILERLEQSTFFGCTALTTVSFGPAVVAIEDSAFAGCTSLAEVALPASCRTISYGAFANCVRLASVTGTPGQQIEVAAGAFVRCKIANLDITTSAAL